MFFYLWTGITPRLQLGIRNRFFFLLHTTPAGLSMGIKNLQSDPILGLSDIFIDLGRESLFFSVFSLTILFKLLSLMHAVKSF